MLNACQPSDTRLAANVAAQMSLRSIIFILLAIGAWLAYHKYGGPKIEPISFIKKKVSATASTDRVVNRGKAPAKCGPYFIYIHPESETPKYKNWKVFVVSNTPPDNMAATEVTELWAYGEATAFLANYRQYSERGTFPRKSIRPATYNEVRFQYIGDDSCGPYKPNKIECDGHSAYCKTFDH